MVYVRYTLILFSAAQAGGADYLEQPSRSDLSKHWKEETLRVIAKASHDLEDKGPETVLQSVRTFLLALGT